MLIWNQEIISFIKYPLLFPLNIPDKADLMIITSYQESSLLFSQWSAQTCWLNLRSDMLTGKISEQSGKKGYTWTWGNLAKPLILRPCSGPRRAALSGNDKFNDGIMVKTSTASNTKKDFIQTVDVCMTKSGGRSIDIMSMRRSSNDISTPIGGSNVLKLCEVCRKDWEHELPVPAGFAVHEEWDCLSTLNFLKQQNDGQGA